MAFDSAAKGVTVALSSRPSVSLTFLSSNLSAKSLDSLLTALMGEKNHFSSQLERIKSEAKSWHCMACKCFTYSLLPDTPFLLVFRVSQQITSSPPQFFSLLHLSLLVSFHEPTICLSRGSRFHSLVISDIIIFQSFRFFSDHDLISTAACCRLFSKVCALLSCFLFPRSRRCVSKEACSTYCPLWSCCLSASRWRRRSPPRLSASSRFS